MPDIPAYIRNAVEFRWPIILDIATLGGGSGGVW